MILESRYNKIIKNVEVTSEMHDRILNNINNLSLDKEASKVIYFSNYRKYLSIAACFLVLLAGTVIIEKTINLSDTPPVEMAPTEGITDYSTLEKLSEAVGYTVKELQDIPFTIDTVQYTSFGGELAQIRYTGQNNTVTLRMSLGAEDISGDYSEYADIMIRTINGYDITMKGNNDRFRLAVWQYDGFSYALHFEEEVSEQDMLTVIKSLQ